MIDIQNPGTGYALGRAFAAERSATEWVAYAQMLERELKIAKAENHGFAAVRDAAIGELRKLDPRNYLLVQENRKNIFERAKAEQMSKKRAA